MNISAQSFELDRFLISAKGVDVEVFEMHERVFHKNAAFPEGKLLSVIIENNDSLVIEIQTSNLKSSLRFERVVLVEFGSNAVSTALTILDSHNRLYLIHKVRHIDEPIPPYAK